MAAAMDQGCGERAAVKLGGAPAGASEEAAQWALGSGAALCFLYAQYWEVHCPKPRFEFLRLQSQVF